MRMIWFYCNWLNKNLDISLNKFERNKELIKYKKQLLRDTFSKNINKLRTVHEERVYKILNNLEI